jgi:magnesium transporter
MPATALVFDGTAATPADLSAARAAIGRAPLVWIDAEGRSPDVEELLRGLQLHPLTIEDIFETGTTPKVEDFGHYLYIRAHGVAVPAEGPYHLRKEELDIVVGSGWVFTHHGANTRACAEVREDLRRPGRTVDASRVAHLLLDRLVDDAIPAMDAIDDAVEELERSSLERVPRRNMVAQVLALRSALHRFRRTAIHQREVLLRLARGEFAAIPKEQLPFFRDVYDHASRLADLADEARDLLGGVLEAHLSMVSNRLNEVTKVLTMTATVFLPISFIAGVYGMNFEYMPELHWRWGYPAVLAAMALTAGGLLLWFRRRGWME